jgi:hypothetical protein
MVAISRVHVPFNETSACDDERCFGKTNRAYTVAFSLLFYHKQPIAATLIDSPGKKA